MLIYTSQINPIIGDLPGNAKKIIHAIAEAQKKNADVVIFSELVLSGYPPQDLLLLPNFSEIAEKYLEIIRETTKNITAIIGVPRKNPQGEGKALYNSAAILQNQKLLGFQDKILLPTYDVFDERRYFEPGDETLFWEINGKKIAITICEDIWEHSKSLQETAYPRNPIQEILEKRPDILFNLSASPFSLHKRERRESVASEIAKYLDCPVVLCNQVGGNDSLIFDGHSVFIDAKGTIKARAKGFTEDALLIDTSEVQASLPASSDPTQDLFEALVLGTKDFFAKQGLRKACLGLSGGIDSALVATIATAALGAENVLGLLMPSRYSSEGSITDAVQLAAALGIHYKTISIEGPFQSYLDLLEPELKNPSQHTTEENLQARVRGMIVMAFSNTYGYLVLSTGNKSELALGYSTLYGDLCGGLAIINDLTKGQVYELSRWINREKEVIPWSTMNKAPSAELKPGQKDSDTLPDYSIIDTTLSSHLENKETAQEIAEKNGYPLPVVQDILAKLYRNEYKRRQSPPGLRISEKAFSKGWQIPIVQQFQHSVEGTGSQGY